MLYGSPAPLHIQDGLLSIVVAFALWALSALVVAYALRRASRDLGERQVPLMGVLAACIFAGQMLNFTVVGGSSGHLLGAAIAVILLGPWPAVLALTCVVAAQAFIFQDGGMLTLGGNIFNMAVVGVFVAHAVYRSVERLAGNRPWGLFAGGFLAGWASIFASALAVALQLALSGMSPANVAVPVMGGIHALIGIGEGLITAGALAFVYNARRDLVVAGSAGRQGNGVVWVAGLALALALAVASPLASTNPDGLEWFARQQGFAQAEQAPLYTLIPGYLVPGIANEVLATVVAGILGTLIVFGVAAVLAYARRRHNAAA